MGSIRFWNASLIGFVKHEPDWCKNIVSIIGLIDGYTSFHQTITNALARNERAASLRAEETMTNDIKHHKDFWTDEMQKQDSIQPWTSTVE